MKGIVSSMAAATVGVFATRVMAQDNSTAKAQDNSTAKRGMSFVGDADSHSEDYDILLSDNSPINWYFTWSPVPAPSNILPDDAASRLEFVPALPGLENLDNNINALGRLPSSTKHLFTFNEPDGTTDSGGSSISPDDAAKAYIEKVVPLRERFQISHPSVTGSPRGLEWLKDFNSSCWDIDSDNGCPADFVTAHFYGDFEGLANWLGQLTDWYNGSRSGIDKDLKVWVKELALP
ncbi:glycosyl hydrolase catalytic core-domain-containing protein, partial [Astrocystis sublimbata]